VIHFERTPKMSTYLASWIIGEFDFVQDNSSGVPVRVYTPVGKAAQGYFALDVASKALKFFSQYFGISYPLPKLDLASFGDFPCGKISD
jgi:puromycin-sensitive aminopeptidase